MIVSTLYRILSSFSSRVLNNSHLSVCPLFKKVVQNEFIFYPSHTKNLICSRGNDLSFQCSESFPIAKGLRLKESTYRSKSALRNGLQLRDMMTYENETEVQRALFGEIFIFNREPMNEAASISTIICRPREIGPQYVRETALQIRASRSRWTSRSVPGLELSKTAWSFSYRRVLKVYGYLDLL